MTLSDWQNLLRAAEIPATDLQLWFDSEQGPAVAFFCARRPGGCCLAQTTQTARANPVLASPRGQA